MDCRYERENTEEYGRDPELYEKIMMLTDKESEVMEEEEGDGEGDGVTQLEELDAEQEPTKSNPPLTETCWEGWNNKRGGVQETGSQSQPDRQESREGPSETGEGDTPVLHPGLIHNSDDLDAHHDWKERENPQHGEGPIKRQRIRSMDPPEDFNTGWHQSLWDTVHHVEHIDCML